MHDTDTPSRESLQFAKPTQTNAQRLAGQGLTLSKRYRSTLSPNRLDAEMDAFARENSEILIGLEAQVNYLQAQLANAIVQLKEIHSIIETV